MSPLIEPKALRTRLASEQPPVVLDVRWSLTGPPGRDEYERGHLPGAAFVDLETELARPAWTTGAAGGSGRHPLPDPADFERAMRRAGVRRDRAVVVYDASDGSAAARAWWLLRWAGLSDVRVLDGGYARWVDNGGEVQRGTVDPEPGDFEVVPGHMPVIDAEGAQRFAADGVLLDARAHERYTGEREPVDTRSGHIPGAVSAPAAEHVDSSGRWRGSNELTGRFEELGVSAAIPVGTYCGSGVNACSVVLALEQAGLRGADNPAVLYAGSWSDFAADPARPAATGPKPR